MVRVSSIDELHALLADFHDRPETIAGLPQAESADESSVLVSRCN
jgi:hypothetical protein